MLVCVVLACGGGQRTTAPADDAPACEAVADHLLELAERDNGTAAGPKLAAGIRDESARQCHEPSRCTVAAPTDRAGLLRADELAR